MSRKFDIRERPPERDPPTGMDLSRKPEDRRGPENGRNPKISYRSFGSLTFFMDKEGQYANSPGIARANARCRRAVPMKNV